jgi:hypothetical protein
MGQGTTRVVDDNGTTGRVRALGDEITDVRRRLDALVMELDRRRHNVTDWKRHARRHGGAMALGALVVAVAVATPMVLMRMRARRRGPLSLLERGAQLTHRARRVGRALERLSDNPEQVPPPTTVAGVGSRTLVAIAAILAQALATAAVRAVVKRPLNQV